MFVPMFAVKYCASHALVLADFPPSTKTADLEKLLENFKNRGFVIRWISDTAALAVFRTPIIDNAIFYQQFCTLACE